MRRCLAATYDGSSSPPPHPTAIRREQQVWGLRGTDDALLRRIDTNADDVYTGQGDQSFYQLTDSSFSVVAHVDGGSGSLRQYIGYEAYGAMRNLLTADFDGDGTVTQDDLDAFNAARKEVPPLPSADFDGNGTVDSADYDAYFAAWTAQSTSTPPIDESRINFAGYVRDPVTGYLLARNRWYDPSIGRWLTRDPAGYVDGLDLYLYAGDDPLRLVDPTGLSDDYLHDMWDGVKSCFTLNPGGVFTAGSAVLLSQDLARKARNAELPDACGEKASKAADMERRAAGAALADTGKVVGTGIEVATRTAFPAGATAESAAEFVRDPSVSNGIAVVAGVLPAAGVIKGVEREAAAAERAAVAAERGIGKVEKEAAGIRPYEVGPFGELKGRSLKGDDIEIHHGPQAHPAGQVIPGYDKGTAPAIALPDVEHRAVNAENVKGPYVGTARGLLAKTARDLRAKTNAPNSAIKELIKQNKDQYPGVFDKQ